MHRIALKIKLWFNFSKAFSKSIFRVEIAIQQMLKSFSCAARRFWLNALEMQRLLVDFSNYGRWQVSYCCCCFCFVLPLVLYVFLQLWVSDRLPHRRFCDFVHPKGTLATCYLLSVTWSIRFSGQVIPRLPCESFCGEKRIHLQLSC